MPKKCISDATLRVISIILLVECWLISLRKSKTGAWTAVTPAYLFLVIAINLEASQRLEHLASDDPPSRYDISHSFFPYL